MGLHIADPSVPAPGEMLGDTYQMPGLRNPSASGSPLMLPQQWDPQHVRTPSLGELHQELENEQEFQVNRLLQEIRRLQAQVQRQNSGQGQSAISDEPQSDRSAPVPIAPTGTTPQSSHPPSHSQSFAGPRSPGIHMHPRSSFDMARADLQRRSRTPSRGASPRLRSASISGDSGEQWLLGGRDESAFYQAETQMLTRENQMLRHRIRDLGKLHGRSSSLFVQTAANTSLSCRAATLRGDGNRKRFFIARTITCFSLAPLDVDSGGGRREAGATHLFTPANSHRYAERGVINHRYRELYQSQSFD